MMNSSWKEYRLSRLMLGTVQLGIPYGVANATGQPSYAEARDMLAAAAEGGINCLDTAAAYGTSEEIIGRALQDLGLAEKMVVATKVRALTPEERSDPARAARAIEESVEQSLRRLRMDCIPLVLFHRELDAAYLHVLERLREKGWLRHAGVSCDSVPGPASALAESAHVAALQIPGSVLDRRQQRSGVFAAAAARGVGVIIRSVYVQGLLLMPEEWIAGALQEMIPVRRRLAEVAAQAGLSLAELAVRYMLGQNGVTSLVIGAERVSQIRENIALFSRGPLGEDVIRAVENAVPDLPDAALVDMWKNLASPPRPVAKP